MVVLSAKLHAHSVFRDHRFTCRHYRQSEPLSQEALLCKHVGRLGARIAALHLHRICSIIPCRNDSFHFHSSLLLARIILFRKIRHFVLD